MCKRRECQEKHTKKANENKVDHWSNSRKEVCMSILCFPGSSAGKESACNVGDLNLIPRLGKSPGNSYPLQYSGLEDSRLYSIL